MIRILSLSAALAVLPLSAAFAGDGKTPSSPAEAAIEAAAAAFEARMETFGKRAEAIAETPGLSEGQREARITALWVEYQPEVTAFTAAVTQHAGAIASAALADIDVEALVSDALNDPEVKAAMDEGVANGVAIGNGIARNSAWTNPDPEQLRTYSLIAQYALDQAADAVEDADDAEQAVQQANAPEAR